MSKKTKAMEYLESMGKPVDLENISNPVPASLQQEETDTDELTVGQHLDMVLSEIAHAIVDLQGRVEKLERGQTLPDSDETKKLLQDIYNAVNKK